MVWTASLDTRCARRRAHDNVHRSRVRGADQLPAALLRARLSGHQAHDRRGRHFLHQGEDDDHQADGIDRPTTRLTCMADWNSPDTPTLVNAHLPAQEEKGGDPQQNAVVGQCSGCSSCDPTFQAAWSRRRRCPLPTCCSQRGTGRRRALRATGSLLGLLTEARAATFHAAWLAQRRAAPLTLGPPVAIPGCTGPAVTFPPIAATFSSRPSDPPRHCAPRHVVRERAVVHATAQLAELALPLLPASRRRCRLSSYIAVLGPGLVLDADEHLTRFATHPLAERIEDGLVLRVYLERQLLQVLPTPLQAAALEAAAAGAAAATAGCCTRTPRTGCRREGGSVPLPIRLRGPGTG